MKVLLVDDEALEIELLTRIIDWQSLHLEIVGHALCVPDAMAQIRVLEPDIIITDICMPGDDGLSLIRDVQLQYPSTQFIIISGYDNFEYAQTAMRYGIREYILKPIDADELTGALVKLCSQINHDNQLRLSTAQATDSIQQLKAQSRARFIPDALQHRLPLELEAVNREHCFHLAAGEFLFCLFRLDIPPRPDNPAPLYDLGSIAYSAMPALESDCIDCAFYSQGQDLWGFFNYPKQSYPNIVGHLKRYADELTSSFSGFANSRLTLSYGKSVNQFASVYAALSTCQLAFRSRIVHRVSNTFAWSEALEPIKPLEAMIHDNDLNTFVKSISIGAFDSAALQIKRFFLLLKEQHNEAEYFFLLAEKLFTSFWEELQSIYSGERPDTAQFKKTLLQCSSVDELEKCLSSHTVVFLSNNLNLNDDQSASVVMIERYLQNHYSEKITLTDISKMVYLSPTYLSAKFKNETGFSFSTYLTNVRIAKAKQLLQTTSLSISEISLDVGIPDVKYFSKLFKKNVGLLPSAYRNRIAAIAAARKEEAAR